MDMGMLESELLERATTQDFISYIALRNVEHREDKRKAQKQRNKQSIANHRQRR